MAVSTPTASLSRILVEGHQRTKAASAATTAARSQL